MLRVYQAVFTSEDYNRLGTEEIVEEVAAATSRPRSLFASQDLARSFCETWAACYFGDVAAEDKNGCSYDLSWEISNDDLVGQTTDLIARVSPVVVLDADPHFDDLKIVYEVADQLLARLEIMRWPSYRRGALNAVEEGFEARTRALARTDARPTFVHLYAARKHADPHGYLLASPSGEGQVITGAGHLLLQELYRSVIIFRNHVRFTAELSDDETALAKHGGNSP